MSSSKRPIFCCTNPRACSTAFERVFMTRQDILTCIHEPFGDAFYFGPERMSLRYEDDEAARESSGFAASTYASVLQRIEREHEEAQKAGKRLFIKDIAYYLVPPDNQAASVAPSLRSCAIDTDVKALSAQEHPNPTVIPASILQTFHFTFLIRHPKYSVPSYYRCTIPPLSNITGFHTFLPSEAGYRELRTLFEYLCSTRQIGPRVAGSGENSFLHDESCARDTVEASITIIDADDLLDNPEGIVRAYCREVSIDFKPEMLEWEGEAAHRHAQETFAKWKGFHEEAIDSVGLKARDVERKRKNTKSIEDENNEWTQRYGSAGQSAIRACVDANLADYEFLRRFALKADA